MKQHRIFTWASAICAILLFCSHSLPVQANSAAVYWQGASSIGVITSDEDCPIEVKSETLTLQIPEFPQTHYDTLEEFLAYSGQVSAEYMFYNPTDSTVTVRLLFPFGATPDYGVLYDSTHGESLYNRDTDKFTITVDGKEVEKSIRYSLTDYNDPFDLSTDLPRLHDGFVQDDFYTPDLPVTRYTFSIRDVDTDTYSAATIAWDMDSYDGATKIYWPDLSGLHTQEDGSLRITGWADTANSLTLYTIGAPLETLPEWKFYQNGGVMDQEEIPGTAVLLTTETMTFQDFALSGWSESSGVSNTDWYNAVVEELRSDDFEASHDLVFLSRYAQNFSGCLMRWYDYTMTLAPGETLTNLVTAPLYPSIQSDYEPPIYEYTYLLSPAQTWSRFGDLQIHLQTPYALIESSLEGFQKDTEGYHLSLEGLPERELVVTLSASDQPTRPLIQGYGIYLLTGIIAAIILFAPCLFLFMRIRRRRASSRK